MAAKRGPRWALPGAMAFGASCVTAWWDEGHLLTAAVAKKYVPGAPAYDAVLQGTWGEFTNFSDLVSAAVWPDHIKCRDLTPEYCKGLALPVNLGTFDDWHFVTVPYNPDNVTLHDMDRFLPFSEAGQLGPVDALSTMMMVDETLREDGTTSPFAWNLLLRLGVHIHGDLHQPLHTASLFSASFPEGDRGGNLIQTRGAGEGISNLHMLWDAVGGAMTRQWPISEVDMKELVDQFTDAYPPEKFIEQGRLSKDWNNQDQNFSLTTGKAFYEAILHDTRSLAPQAYWEFLESRGSAMKQDLYAPSSSYVEQVKHNASMQVVLGGYRLASWLNALQSRVPQQPLDSTTISPANLDNMNTVTAGVWALLGGAVGALTGVVGTTVVAMRVARRSVAVAVSAGVAGATGGDRGVPLMA